MRFIFVDMRYRKIAIFSLICLVLSSRANAGIGDWIRNKLPYKLPPEKIVYQKHLPQSTKLFLDRFGRPLVYQKTSKLQIFRKSSEISPDLKKFVVLAEDAKFYQHSGFDLKEIKKSISDKVQKGKKIRGASTITQQIAKNLFLDQKKSYIRKLFEIPWAKKIENDLSKEQILELYLNIIEWGPGIYGAEAASRHYFDQKALEISSCQALYLTMIIPNPKKFDAFLGEGKVNFILKKIKSFTRRIYGEKRISTEEFETFQQCTISLVSQNRHYPFVHRGSYEPQQDSYDRSLSEKLTKLYTKSRKSEILTSLDRETPLDPEQLKQLSLDQLKQSEVEKIPSKTDSDSFWSDDYGIEAPLEFYDDTDVPSGMMEEKSEL